MTVAYTVPEAKRAEIPAVVHVDGSMRPQTVTPSSQPRYYAVIDRVGKAKGVPVILNTSLNVKGEPIACTPAGDHFQCALPKAATLDQGALTIIARRSGSPGAPVKYPLPLRVAHE